MNTVQKVIKGFAIGLGVFIIIAIVGIIFSIITLITNVDFLLGKETDFEETYTDINVIDIESSYANIYIKRGFEFKVEAKSVTSKFSSKEKNGTLKITEKRNWLLFWKDSGDITIYIPNEIDLGELKIESGAGQIEIEEISAKKLDINQGAGTLYINDSTFYDTEIDGGAGEIKITDSVLEDLELDAGVGKVEIEAELIGNSKLDCGVGEINLTLLGDESSYKIKADKGIGNIKIDGNDYNKDATYGNGTNKIEVEGGIGEINVSFSRYAF